MASNIADFRASVQSRIKDTATKLSVTALTGDIDRAVLAAVEQYSVDRPLERAVRLPGDGGFKYPVASLTGFIDEFTVVRRIAYPHLPTDQNPSWLANGDFGLERRDDGLFLWFYNARPLASEFFLALYTTPHTVSDTASSIPASDDEALADLGAAFAFDKLASYYIEGTVIIDNSIQLSKSKEFREQAKVFRGRYNEKITTRPVAGAVAAVASFSDFAGSDYFFHGRRVHGRP
jgi:hypothetical protein